jgi:hypothetical protein
MSYSLLNGDQVATANWNGRSRAATGSKSRERTAEESLLLELLLLALDDTKILCRYGIIRRSGELREWPKVKTFRDGYQRVEPMNIAGMSDPLEHFRLRKFWNEPALGQCCCNIVGFGVPAKEVWKSILKNHAK